MHMNSNIDFTMDSNDFEILHSKSTLLEYPRRFNTTAISNWCSYFKYPIENVFNIINRLYFKNKNTSLHFTSNGRLVTN